VFIQLRVSTIPIKFFNKDINGVFFLLEMQLRHIDVFFRNKQEHVGSYLIRL